MGLEGSERLVRGGLQLFLDLVLTTLGGWLFWLLISSLTGPAEVGYATTAASLVGLVGGLFGLGLDYSLLREVASGANAAFGTALAFEAALLLLFSPALLALGLLIYGPGFTPYMALASALLLLSGLSLVARSSSIALLETGKVLLYDGLGTAARFASGLGLVAWGLGGLGILSASVVQAATATLPLLALCWARLGLSWGGLGALRGLLRLGLGNVPSRLSGLLVGGLSVVLLAALTGDPEGVGIFYIALAISLVAGGLASSLALVALPLSSSLGRDASVVSLRLGLCITAPLVAGLLAAPGFVLSLIGPAYVRGSEALRVLSLSVLPSVLVGNAVTRLNYQGKIRALLLLGLVQLAALALALPLLVPMLGELGAALSILMSSLLAGALCMNWLPRGCHGPLAASLLAVALGALPSLALPWAPQHALFLISVGASLLAVLASRQLRIGELLELLRAALA
jgi:O-antigen/teichoic acid export membrane protein